MSIKLQRVVLIKTMSISRYSSSWNDVYRLRCLFQYSCSNYLHKTFVLHFLTKEVNMCNINNSPLKLKRI